MEKAKELVEKRDRMEQELRQLKFLLTQNNTNMTDPLVDPEGYPRSDVDVYAIRKTRHDIICLENDLRALMKEIEEALAAVHSMQHVSTTSSSNDKTMDWKTDSSSGGDAFEGSAHRTSNQVFLRAEEISPGSPAEQSGLLSGDQIVQFGSLCCTNFSNLQQVAEIVRNSVDAPIRITVLRDMHAERLTLVPKSWSGQGLLGCRVVPVIRH